MSDSKAEGLLGDLWAIIFMGTIVARTVHEKIRIANQGDGFNCGMSLRVGVITYLELKRLALFLISFLVRRLGVLKRIIAQSVLKGLLLRQWV